MMLYDACVQEAVHRAVATLATERPGWIPVLEAAIAVSDRVDPYGGEFAGAWVLEELERRTGHRTWLPNLRVLVSYGLLEKAGESTRRGRRAYYRFASKRSVEEALARLSPNRNDVEAQPRHHRFHLVGAGDSGEAGSDVARRSANLPFEPRSWR